MPRMRAVVFKDQRLTLTELPIPEAGPGELLLKVERSSICGTDVHLIRQGKMPATILGHEFSGTVVGIGAGVDGFAAGQTVTSMPTKACGQCDACRSGDPKRCRSMRGIGLSMPANGGFAEYVIVGANESFILPPGVDARTGALTECLAVGLKQAEECRVRPGDKLVVLGAGPAGMATVLWAHAMGVGDIVVSDPVPVRRELALKMGATAVIDPAAEDLQAFCARQLGGAPQVVMECIGRPGSYDMAMNLVAAGGRVVIGGLHQEAEQIGRFVPFIKEVDVRYCWMYEKRHYRHTLNMLAQGRIKPLPMITHEIGLAELPGMLETLSQPNSVGKVLVNPGLTP